VIDTREMRNSLGWKSEAAGIVRVPADRSNQSFWL